MTDPILAGPIVVIDDDPEDLELTKELIKIIGIPNEVLLFTRPDDALGFLTDMIQFPFFIICDINMPKLDGFQLREALLEKMNHAEKIPFFFLSTSKSPAEVKLAEEYSVTGYYQKAASFTEQQQILKAMYQAAQLF